MHANILRFFSAKMVTLLSVSLPHSGKFLRPMNMRRLSALFRFFNVFAYVLDRVDLKIVGNVCWIVETFWRSPSVVRGPDGPRFEVVFYWSVAACARPKPAFEVCAPAQNGTTVSAKSFCDCHTSAKNSFSAAAASSDFLAAAIYSVK